MYYIQAKNYYQMRKISNAGYRQAKTDRIMNKSKQLQKSYSLYSTITNKKQRTQKGIKKQQHQISKDESRSRFGNNYEWKKCQEADISTNISVESRMPSKSGFKFGRLLISRSNRIQSMNNTDRDMLVQKGIFSLQQQLDSKYQQQCPQIIITNQDKSLSQITNQPKDQGSKAIIQKQEQKQKKQTLYSSILDLDKVLIQRFHIVLNLYIKEQILKHHIKRPSNETKLFSSNLYYSRLTKFATNKQKEREKLVKSIILPTLHLLAVPNNKIKYIFQPYLSSISERYLLATQLDPYWGQLRKKYSAEDDFQVQEFLYMQLMQTMLKIKQAEIDLKRIIRQELKRFKYRFCTCSVYNDSKLEFNKQKLYEFLFDSTNAFNGTNLRMVNVIKLSIFVYKVMGEEEEESIIGGSISSIEDWLENY